VSLYIAATLSLTKNKSFECFKIKIILLNGKIIFFPYSEKHVLSKPELKDPIPVEYLSHADRYAAELKKACLLFSNLEDLPGSQVESLK